MPEKIYITNRIRKLIVSVLALLYISLCMWSIVTTRNWIGRPFPGFLLMKNNIVPIFWISDWEGFKQEIKFGDLVVAVNGQTVKSSNEVNDIVLHSQPGTYLTYTVIRGIKTKQQLKFSISVSLFTIKDYLIILFIPMTIGLLIYSLSLVVFYLKPNLMASLSFLILGSVWGISLASVSEHVITNVNFITIICLPLLGPSILFFGLNFPVEYNYSKKSIAILLSITALIVFFYLYSYLSLNIVLYRYFDTIMQINNVILGLSGLILVIRSFLTSDDPVVRQKGKVVIYGFSVAFFSLLIMLVGTLILKKVNALWIVFPIAAFILSIGYSIVKHNLFDVDILIRRSISYLLVSGVVIILFFFLIGLFSLVLQSVVGRSSQIAAVLSTLLMVMIFRPFRNRVDQTLDRRFFRETYKYRETIQKASEILISIIDLEELLQRLVDTVIDSMKIERGGILLRQGNPERYEVVIAKGYEDFTVLAPLGPEHTVVRLLEQRKRAVQINDVHEFEEFAEHRELFLGMMTKLDLVLVIPVLYEQRLIGIFGLAAKKSGAWYSSEDIELLQTLMNHTAVSIENARKIEELKKMVELETSYRELQRVDEMKDNFLSMVSHDLRTPMTSIKGYTSLLKKKLDKYDRERIVEYLDIIGKECDRLTRLVNNLLDLQRFEAGSMHLNTEDLDLLEIIRESVKSFRGAALDKQITLKETLPDEQILIHADRDKLLQVMANFLSNALKFTPEKGKVSVATELIYSDHNKDVKITISDNGSGVPEQDRSKLFDRFQQVEGLVRDKQQGSGLGLALVKEIVEHHAGSVGVDSVEGKGSNFYFVLPLNN